MVSIRKRANFFEKGEGREELLLVPVKNRK
jgi:hypothetical protein